MTSSQRAFQTPALGIPQSSGNLYAVSPTTPLNVKKLNVPEATGDAKRQSVHKNFPSENSLSSKLTQSTDNSASSYATAMDGTENVGLGIKKMSVISPENDEDSQNDDENQNLIAPDTYSSEYNDEATPKLNGSMFEPPKRAQHPPSSIYDDDVTPKLKQHPFQQFTSTTHNKTPVIEPESRHQNLQYPEMHENANLPFGANTFEKALPENPNNNTISNVTEAPTAHDTSFSQSFNDTTYSQESNHLQTLKRDKHTTTNLFSDPSHEPTIPELSKHDENLITLFLAAVHPFDATSLKSSADSAICLSFDKNDVVFVHSVDPSGWGEITMIKNFQRGWVPINYFTEYVKQDSSLPISKSKEPLKYLLVYCAKFIRDPTDNLTQEAFSISSINDIRDGVRVLLQETDCLSRSSDVVKKKPIIRRIRKSLLADWYSLMVKADSYKHTATNDHIETLQLMALQVIKKAVAFLEIWCIESESLKVQKKQPKIKKQDPIPYLAEPPFAKPRLIQINNILFTYIGLILGRLDMVEHNPVGCELLENLTHQIILLLRELLFLSKSCAIILGRKNRKLDVDSDDSLDTILSLVSELVSSLKNFVTKTIHEDYASSTVTVKEGVYYYTAEGEDLIGIVSRMTRAISVSVEQCFKHISVVGDFQLSDEKKYPDFRLLKIEPDQFIKTCSEGLIKSFDKRKIDLKSLVKRDIRRQSRFSTVRSGLNSELSLTTSGTNILQEFLPDSKSFIRSSVFQPYLNENEEEIAIEYDPRKEITYDSAGKLIGASFKALVYLLTDELNKPDSFFISSFFLTFKLYSDGNELIEELIARFNLENRFDIGDDYDELGEYSSYESRLKNRRRLICTVISIWLQSYWDYQCDYNLLPTMINFANEGVSQYLPIESKKLIELCSKLTSLTPNKIQNSKSVQSVKSYSPKFDIIANNKIQLVGRNPKISRTSSIISSQSTVSNSCINEELDNDDYIFEEYQLAKIHSNHRNSIYLPLPGLNNYNNNILLSKSQTHDLEQNVVKYRRFLGEKNWPFHENRAYQPIELSKLLEPWFTICSTVSTNIINADFNFVDLNSFEVAKQLTLIESKMFLMIKPDELLNQNFTNSKSQLNLSPNISRSLLFTNLLSEYVLESILVPHLTLKKRAERFSNWLNVALSCYYLKNFNSLAAIIISLQNHIFSKLKMIWDNLLEKYKNLFNDLKKIIHPTNNYKGYRYKISKLLEEGEGKCPRPVIPYINLFLQDLTFINEGNKDFRNSNTFLRSKIINVDKFLKVSKVVSNLEYLQVGYSSVVTKKSRRNSVFSFSSSSTIDDKVMPVLSLEEYILFELWRVHQLCLREEDRHWNLSKRLQT